MAVIQISKIQVRRGQKNSNSGVPQLSSAEFAWAVDSQELFIGNGSVLEGAPYVGNTKILTEHDNILDLASSYQYANNDTSITLSVPRSLQSKLDEVVSVADFGAIGDGSTDCVEAFETALDQLFKNVNDNFKKVLLVPNGEYLFLSDIRIPSKTIIRGETQLGAIMNIGNNNIRFVTSNGEEISFFDSSNRPTDIYISNLTIKRQAGQIALTGVSNSKFEDIKFQGEYVLGDLYASIPSVEINKIENNVCTTTSIHNLEIGDRYIPRTNGNGLTAGQKYFILSIPTPTQFVLSLSSEGPATSLINGGLTPDENGSLIPISIIGDIISDILSSLTTQPSAVFWNNDIDGIKVDNINFKSCIFESNCVSVRCIQTERFATTVKFNGCRFFINDTAIYIQGVPYDPERDRWQENNWQIVECEFEEIHKQAFRATNGRGTLIQQSKFKNCGNGSELPRTPIDYIVYFGENVDNQLINCQSDRQQSAGVIESSSIPFIPEVFNGNRVNFTNRNYAIIGLSDSFKPLAVFSALSRYMTINYSLSLDVFSRVGKLTLSIGDNLSQLAITDEYQYSPPTLSSTLGSDGGEIMTKFEFTAELKDNDNDSGIETVLLSYKNPSPSVGPTAPQYIYFDVTYGV